MICLDINERSELDALGLEEEEEGPSYLSELNKAPDFVDEAPVEEVLSLIFMIRLTLTFFRRHQGRRQSRHLDEFVNKPKSSTSMPSSF